jgi:hypothetical protein
VPGRGSPDLPARNKRKKRGKVREYDDVLLGHAGASTTRKGYTNIRPDRSRDILLPVEEFFPAGDAEAP